MDTYPIYNGKNKLNFWSIFPYLVIIVLAFLLFKACGKPVPQPIVITGKEVRDTIRIVDKEAQRVRDSFMVVLLKKYKDDDNNYQAYLRLLNENAVLLNQNEILSSYVPDSCKELQANWVAKFNQVKIASDKKDLAANRTITGLQSTVSTQKKFLSQKDIDYAKMKSIADTCSVALSAMEKYAKKIKPKREISVGISGMTNYINLNPAIGLGLGYRTQKGLTFDANIYSNKTITVGIKKTIFSF